MRRFLCLALALSLARFSLEAASLEPVRAEHGIVVSTNRIASQIGVDVLRRGGNAVDAAVAVGFALAVTLPFAGNIGGGGFMLIRSAGGECEVIDYRERAPLAATRTMFVDEHGALIEGASSLGHKAVAVPGTVAGLALAHARHGKLKWKDLVEPAVSLARKGFTVDAYLARTLRPEDYRKRLERFEESRRIFLRDGTPYREGDRFAQPDLSSTLERIARRGPREFYEGETARLIVEEMKRGGGIITMNDLASYEPSIRKPLLGTYRGDYTIMTMPPPSSGGIALIEMLNILESFDLGSLGHNSSGSIHLLVETMRRAFADRAESLGDADFVDVPSELLTSKQYAAMKARAIGRDHATPSLEIKTGEGLLDSTKTTHYSVIDAVGNVVSNTYTINDWYGSGVTVKGAGFLLNNEMDDFASRPGTPNLWGLIQGEKNAILPRKRPLSSMTPTIVLKHGQPFLVVGGAGGPTIINTVLQVILNVIDFGMDIQQAVDASRIHHQWLPDAIKWEKDGLSPDTKKQLEALGHRFDGKPGGTEKFGYLGDTNALMIEPDTRLRLGAADPRRGGAAVGY